MKKIKKANALVLTTVILFAVALIATSLTTYFYYAAIQNQNANLYTQKHIELENEFNKNYEIMVKNSRISQNDESSPNLSSQASMLNESNSIFNFTNNKYKNKFEYVSSTSTVITFTHTIETSQTMKSGRVREYSLVKTLTVQVVSGVCVFNILSEDYYVSNV